MPSLLKPEEREAVKTVHGIQRRAIEQARGPFGMLLGLAPGEIDVQQRNNDALQRLLDRDAAGAEKQETPVRSYDGPAANGAATKYPHAAFELAALRAADYGQGFVVRSEHRVGERETGVVVEAGAFATHLGVKQIAKEVAVGRPALAESLWDKVTRFSVDGALTSFYNANLGGTPGGCAATEFEEVVVDVIDRGFAFEAELNISDDQKLFRLRLKPAGNVVWRSEEIPLAKLLEGRDPAGVAFLAHNLTNLVHAELGIDQSPLSRLMKMMLA